MPTEAWHLYWIVGTFQVKLAVQSGNQDTGTLADSLSLAVLAYRTAMLTPKCHYTGSNNLGGY